MLTSNTRNAVECVELHLVSEEGLSGMLYIQAWRDQARRFTQVAKEGNVLDIERLTIKAIGDKRQWQCTDLDVYGQIMGGTQFREVDDDSQCPAEMHTVLLRTLPYFQKIPHMINLAAVLVDLQPTTSAQISAPAFNVVLGDEDLSVRVAIWKDHAQGIDAKAVEKGTAITLTCLRVRAGNENTTELSSSRATTLMPAPDDVSVLLTQRTNESAKLVSMSRQVAGIDYSAVTATAVHLNALTSMIVPNAKRDLSDQVYEVFHCIVEDVEPVPESEHIFYMGCPVCKKKVTEPRQCTHQEEAVPHYLAVCNIATLEHNAQAKAIGSVIATLLGVPASDCVPDAQGYSKALEGALDVLRGTPFNMRFVIGSLPNGNKHVLELVHATPTLVYPAGTAAFPVSGWRLVDGEISGVPPCGVDALQLEGGFKLLHGKPVASVQVFVSIADTGDEDGALSRDKDLVRLKRAALCCLTGTPVTLVRTGELAGMNKYIRWNKGDLVFLVVRILDKVEGVWNFAIKGSKKFDNDADARVFNSYYTQYCELSSSIWGKIPLAMDNSWTPKRRRKELSDDVESRGELTPRSFEGTPVKFNNR